MITKSCLKCKKDFQVYNYRKDIAKYCSYDCMNKFAVKKCLVCDSDFRAYLSQETKGRGKCCSVKCANLLKRTYSRTDAVKLQISLHNGRGMLGKKHTLESRNKISLKQTGLIGSRAKRWRGDLVGYGGLHNRIRTQFGQASRCEFCHGIGKSYQWANISGQYLTNMKDWKQLCISCHIKFDRTRKSRFKEYTNQI